MTVKLENSHEVATIKVQYISLYNGENHQKQIWVSNV